MKTIFEIIQERLAQLNKKNNWLADKIGTSPQNINNWRVRGVPPKEVARVAQALGLDRDALENGELLLSINEKSLNGNNGHMHQLRPVLAYDALIDLPEGDFVMVRKLDVAASAGFGSDNNGLVMEDKPIAFRADWIRKSKAKSTDLVVLDVDGDSMHPTLFDGDDVLIDLKQNQIANGNVYAFVVDGVVIVKRLSVRGSVVIAQSDNQSDPRFKYDSEYSENETFKVIGRVVNRSGAGNL